MSSRIELPRGPTSLWEVRAASFICDNSSNEPCTKFSRYGAAGFAGPARLVNCALRLV